MNLKIVCFAAASLLNAALLFAGDKPNVAGPQQVAADLGRLLELGHYSGWKLGPEMSKRILETYLEDLDSNKAFLTQGDVNQLSARYGSNIGRAVLLGDLGSAKAIYDIFKARVEERIAKVCPLISKDYNFKSDRFVDLDRRKKQWPANIDECDSLWTDRIEGELLQERLSKTAAAASGPKVLARRYDELLKDVEDRGEEDIDEIFLNAVAESYDPHSEYLGQSNLESFEIDMRLSLVGIGAEMRAAMQDYGRALIVGDSSTFGKGTVQMILRLGRTMPLFGSSSAGGALDLTVQKFYRVTGGSTQLRGVISDVKLPSITDNAEYGENALNHPLAYDEIESVPVDLAGNRKVLFKDELRRRSAVRVRHDPEFQDIAEDVQELNERLKNNRLSLNETTRRTERAKNIKQREKEEADRRNAEQADRSKTYELNLAHVNKRQLPLLEKSLATTNPAPRSYNPVDAALDEGEENDLEESGPAKREALNILSDLIGFSKSSRTVGR